MCPTALKNPSPPIVKRWFAQDITPKNKNPCIKSVFPSSYGMKYDIHHKNKERRVNNRSVVLLSYPRKLKIQNKPKNTKSQRIYSQYLSATKFCEISSLKSLNPWEKKNIKKASGSSPKYQSPKSEKKAMKTAVTSRMTT